MLESSRSCLPFVLGKVKGTISWLLEPPAGVGDGKVKQVTLYILREDTLMHEKL